MIIQQTIDVKKNFEAVREKLQISQREVARRAGLAAGSLSGILAHNNPKVQQLVSLSRGLGVSVRYLVGGGDPVEELKQNYDSEDSWKKPRLRSGWKPEVPNVAARVEIILKQTGQRKKDAAQRINVHYGWWSLVFRKNNPTMRMLERIAYAINVEPVNLVTSVSYDEYGKVMIPKNNVKSICKNGRENKKSRTV